MGLESLPLCYYTMGNDSDLIYHQPSIKDVMGEKEQCHVICRLYGNILRKMETLSLTSVIITKDNCYKKLCEAEGNIIIRREFYPKIRHYYSATCTQPHACSGKPNSTPEFFKYSFRRVDKWDPIWIIESTCCRYPAKPLSRFPSALVDCWQGRRRESPIVICDWRWDDGGWEHAGKGGRARQNHNGMEPTNFRSAPWWCSHELWRNSSLKSRLLSRSPLPLFPHRQK